MALSSHTMASEGKFESDDEMLVLDDDMLVLGNENDDNVVTQQRDQYPASRIPPGYFAGHQQPPYPIHQDPYPPYPSGVPMMPYAPPASMSQMSNNTTVIINQPGVGVARGPRGWSSNVCSCCDDCGSCLMGLFCPCVLASQIASNMDESCCVPCCVPGWLIVLRTKLRAENNIMGSVMDDCCTVCCCGICVMCQMARELRFIKNSRQ